jgi:AcrR family transcriptional regulator
MNGTWLERSSILSESEAKKKIIATVQELLQEGCPTEEITVRKIAERAGVGIGTVSYHFHSKERLVYEAVAQQMNELTGVLAPNTGAGTVFERLRRFCFETAELALQYSAIFHIQLSYEIVHGDMSICYFIIPLLKEHFGGAKSDLEIKLIALQIITAMQMILLKMEVFSTIYRC